MRRLYASAAIVLTLAFGLPTVGMAQFQQDTQFFDDGTGLSAVLRTITSGADLPSTKEVLGLTLPPTPSSSTAVGMLTEALFSIDSANAVIRVPEPMLAMTSPSSPRTISYQGILRNEYGTEVANGEYAVTIRLYGDSSGSRELWRDTYQVQVSNGVFSILLGSGTQPLPDAATLDRPLWLSMQVGAGEEMRPFSPLSAVPYALNVADKSISASKISADYVRSLSINGQTVVGNGADIAIRTGDGIAATVDPQTGSILLQANGTGSTGKGGEIQGNTTISGALTVTGSTTLGSGSSTPITINSLTANLPVKSNSNKQLVSAAIDLANTSESDVTGVLPAGHGGTGQSSYATGDLLYASSSTSLSKLGVGTRNQVLGVSGGLPAYVENGATITNTVSTPAQLTGSVDNYTVDASSTYIRLSNTSGGPIDLTGINSTGISSGRVITLVNMSSSSSNAIVIKHQGSSSAGNQFDLPGASDMILGPRGAATFIYDATAGFWEFYSSN
ncbi:MAG: hypothetical protein Q8922_01025 [Bacteroidota bacterium]|nr:hypothetical protein [Bacteroidota bacterium]MDP4232616.1 hypothetical protein [Bacteroidota bacterium]MDP4242930.1 hypothetical protein [Bacteroidota bacterium]MDP4286495.1 hypothetical protein [Bacteroidota bacterium]